MSSALQGFQEILADLYEQLEEISSLDPELRAPLRPVLREIEQVLSCPEPMGKTPEH